ncbi:MAG TPA: NADH dehydrogenase (quinone) subunit D [Chloroflexota bacterium]|nr:NADH dehydrogenase (quinone) subunit D [Chloroflexota bacterium]
MADTVAARPGTTLVEEDGKLLLNMGPQHPATHGVLRLVLELDGEIVVSCRPVIGYVHTGIEKTYENKTYHQDVTMTDRMDYLCPLSNNLAFALCVEKLFGIEAPPRAQVARVILAELTRLNSHLVWLGTQALDLGAISVFLYCFREREMLLDIFELCSGQRMMTSYIRPGGLYYDLPDDFAEKVEEILRVFPPRIDEYEDLLTNNELWRDRTIGIGKIGPADAIAWGLSGPSLRASGVNWDVRKSEPYSGYEKYEFDVPLGTNGDVYDRYMCRMREMRQSLRIIRQALDVLPGGDFVVHDHKIAFPSRTELATSMEALIHHFKIATEGYRVPAGEAFVPVESPRGEMGFYIVSDGSGKPYKAHVRAPSFYNLAAISKMAEGLYVADLVALIGSLDPVLGDVDR